MITTTAGGVTALALVVAAASTVTAQASPLAHRTVEYGGQSHVLTLAGPTTLTPGLPVPVAGSGYNVDQGIFVALCAIPPSVDPDDPRTFTARPTPCLGTRGDGDSSHRVVNGVQGDHTSPYGPGGSFAVRLTLQPRLAEGVECDVDVRCAIVTRADFTATQDRTYDLYVPIRFTHQHRS